MQENETIANPTNKKIKAEATASMREVQSSNALLIDSDTIADSLPRKDKADNNNGNVSEVQALKVSEAGDRVEKPVEKES